MTGPTVEPTWAAIVDGRVVALSETAGPLRRQRIPRAAVDLVTAGIAVGDTWPPPRPVGRPAVGPQRAIRYPAEVDARVVELARRDGVSVSEAYRRCVERGLR